MITRHRHLSAPLLALCFVLQIPNVIYVSGHGRLMDPPARNCMWRFGFPNAVNYNDNELFCGGYAVQWVQNKGQCGTCGDPYHLKPRPHEAGGEYAKGTIVRHYTAGQHMDVEVELTANHLGYFEMYLCPNNNPRKEASQECFDRYPLYVVGTRDVRFQIPNDSEKKAVFRYKVALPPYVTCSQCVVQWNYYTGNMWGTCDNGTEAVGCGQPETFRNCADISIVTSTGARPPTFVQQLSPFTSTAGRPSIYVHQYKPFTSTGGGLPNFAQHHNPFTSTGERPLTFVQHHNPFTSTGDRPLTFIHHYRPFDSTGGRQPNYVQKDNPFYLHFKEDYERAAQGNIFPLVIRNQVCVATYLYRTIPGMNDWCQSNCVRYPPNCPKSVCRCPESCDGIGDIEGREGASVYCLDKCLVYPSQCPAQRCRCY